MWSLRQNIPIRTAEGRNIRKAFITGDPDYGFFSADYSQVELRLMAHLSGTPELINAFLKGEDVHAATASKIYHVPLEEVTPEMRRRAKTANFGIIYGISAWGLAERLKISRKEGKELIEGYFALYPGVKRYMEESVEKARKKGYVETIMGRRRYLSAIEWDFSHLLLHLQQVRIYLLPFFPAPCRNLCPFLSSQRHN